ncbi:MAG: hypothetical protein FJW30_14730 [Acidobacteria bacterium]|nr:hypothetical protein [Acidobacteriota bacterium]
MKIARAIERLLPVLLFFTTLATSYYWWRSEQRYESALQRISSLQKERRSVLEPPPPAPAVPPKPEVRTTIVKVPSVVESPESLKTIEELRARLKEQIAELGEAREGRAAADAARSAAERAAQTQLTELRDQIEPLRKLNAALEAEIKFKNERLARAEAAPGPKPAPAPPAKPPGLTPADIERNRRRDALFASLQRRYREVTDLYRSFALRQPELQAGELSRIQSTIQMAEDELRQLQALK